MKLLLHLSGRHKRAVCVLFTAVAPAPTVLASTQETGPQPTLYVLNECTPFTEQEMGIQEQTDLLKAIKLSETGHQLHSDLFYFSELSVPAMTCCCGSGWQHRKVSLSWEQSWGNRRKIKATPGGRVQLWELRLWMTNKARTQRKNVTQGNTSERMEQKAESEEQKLWRVWGISKKQARRWKVEIPTFLTTLV